MRNATRSSVVQTVLLITARPCPKVLFDSETLPPHSGPVSFSVKMFGGQRRVVKGPAGGRHPGATDHVSEDTHILPVCVGVGRAARTRARRCSTRARTPPLQGDPHWDCGVGSGWNRPPNDSARRSVALPLPVLIEPAPRFAINLA